MTSMRKLKKAFYTYYFIHPQAAIISRKNKLIPASYDSRHRRK
jgi:hypothetical protein